jgi:hypothetical protein
MTLYEIFSAFAEKITLYEVISVFVSLGALILVLWQIREFRLQLKCNFHQEFDRRYTELVTKMPYRAFEDRQLTLADCLKEEADFKMTAQLYFWLIQEERDLPKKHQLPPAQWKIWDDQFRLTMKSKCFRQVWEDVKKAAAYPDNFVCYVDGITREYELEDSSSSRTTGYCIEAVQKARDFFGSQATNWSDAEVVYHLLAATRVSQRQLSELRQSEQEPTKAGMPR